MLTGSTLTLFQTPQPGDAFSGWGGACSGAGASCTVQLQGSSQVTAAWVSASATQALTVGVSGNGSVSGGGISCPSTCTASEPLDSAVTLTASPSSGYTFTGWGGDCTGTGSCTLTMSADHSVTASFAQAVNLSVSVTGSGNVSGGSGAINCGSGASVCSAPFAANASVTLVATPQTGASFVGWTGACGGSATTCTVSMTASRSVTATFTGGTPLTVSTNGPGTVTGGGITCGSRGSTCSAAETANAGVTLTATPDGGASFSGWGGACSGASATCTVTMSSAQSVSASFSTGAGGGSSLTVVVTGSGAVTGGGINCGRNATACSISVAAGTAVTLSEQPAAGSSFSGWGGACSGTAPTCAVTVQSATTVSARFGPAPPGTLTLIVGGRGAVSSSAGSCASTGPSKTCVQHLRPSSRVTLREAPRAGARFLGWGGACATRKTAATCTVALTVARSVSARFTGASAGGGAGGAVTSLGRALVLRRGGEFQVTLRFSTTIAGVARVRGLRAGRVAATLSLRVAAGNATMRVPVGKAGSYVFELRLGGRIVRWNACLGVCGTAVKSPVFVVAREAPTIVRAGDGWSLTLRLRSNLISADRVQVRRGTRTLLDLEFLGRSGQNSVPPFLLGPGDYRLTITATDAYGRVRTLTWIVALAG